MQNLWMWNYKAVESDNCKFWVHIKCNKINKQTYNLSMEDDTDWYCIKCTKSIFHSMTLTITSFILQGKKIKFTKFSKKTNSNEHILTERLNNMTNQKEFDNPSAYYDYNPIKTLTKSFMMAQIFYIWTLTLLLTVFITFMHYPLP